MYVETISFLSRTKQGYCLFTYTLIGFVNNFVNSIATSFLPQTNTVTLVEANSTNQNIYKSIVKTRNMKLNENSFNKAPICMTSFFFNLWKRLENESEWIQIDHFLLTASSYSITVQ